MMTDRSRGMVRGRRRVEVCGLIDAFGCVVRLRAR